MTKRKTTPHLKRGPKPKPKPQQPKRKPGRPEMPLCLHPDRYALARFDVAAVWLKGNLYKGERMGAATILAMGAVRQGEEVADLRKAGDRLRQMSKRFRKPDDIKWRKAIGKAAAHTMLAAAAGTDPEPERVNLIMDYADRVGEAEWARRELLPLIGMKQTGSLLDLTPDERLPSLALIIAMVGWASEVLSWHAARKHPEIAGICCPA